MFFKTIKSILFLFTLLVLTSNITYPEVGEGTSEVGILSSVPGKEPIIFIPGIMGSPLYNSNDNELKWNERVWVNRTKALSSEDDHLDPLMLNENGYDPFSNDYHIKVSPKRNSNRSFEDEFDDAPLDSYEGILNYLVTNHSYKLDNMDNSFDEGENLFCFVYDWRKDNAFNAQLLRYFVLDVLRWTKKIRVNIIAHSMGGLVAKSLIQSNNFNKSKIDKIIFIGTPHLGAPKSIYTALTGNLMIEFLGFNVFNHSKIMDISRNMPSSYQLLPSRDYHNFLWNGHSILPQLYDYSFEYMGEEYNYNQTRNFLKLTHIGEKTLNAALIDKSEIFQNSVKDLDFANIKTYNIVGIDLPTIGKVIINKQMVKPIFNINGDGTVPLKSAEIVGSSKLLANKTFYISGVEHQELPSSTPTLEIISGLLNNPPIFDGFSDTRIKYTPPISYGTNIIQVLAACPVVLHAYDEFNNHTGPTSDSTWEENIPGSFYMPTDLSDTSSVRAIILPAGKEYRYEIHSQGYISNFDLYLDDIKDGSPKTSLVYENVQIEENTIATTNISSVNANISIEVDLDGNGTTDETIHPTTVTSAKRVPIKIPTDYKLYQNYPNPFNPSTRISYSIPKASFVTLKVFDTLGKEITTLVNEQKSTGYYKIDFDASSLSNGIYFYTLQTGEYSETKRMILLK